MSKKINAALKDLVKALAKHAEAAGTTSPSVKRVERASARVTAAANAYAEAVFAKSGLENPFVDIPGSGLEQATLASLTAERDSLARTVSENAKPIRKAS